MTGHHIQNLPWLINQGDKEYCPTPSTHDRRNGVKEPIVSTTEWNLVPHRPLKIAGGFIIEGIVMPPNDGDTAGDRTIDTSIGAIFDTKSKHSNM